jgi:hypothetical protein
MVKMRIAEQQTFNRKEYKDRIETQKQQLRLTTNCPKRTNMEKLGQPRETVGR